MNIHLYSQAVLPFDRFMLYTHVNDAFDPHLIREKKLYARPPKP